MIPEGFRGAAKRLDAIDIPRAGRLIGVGEDEIRAILEVESRGSGFDSRGRPAMLFEPHLFYRNLKGAKRNRAVKEGLAYQAWRRDYPKDSYPRLIQAMEIDHDAALMSASWGLGQVLGSNHRMAGFETVTEFVAAMCADEEHHLEAMIRFIKARGIDDEVRRHDWAGFARVYNGPAFAKNQYDKRLARSFAKWQKIKDHPFHIETAAVEDQEAGQFEAETFADRAKIKAVQEKLRELGYHMVGKPDGVFGPRTAGAISAFQKETGLPITGEITDALIGQLEAAAPFEVSPERAEGGPEGSRIVEQSKAIEKVGGALAGSGVIAGAGKALETAEEAKGIIDRVKAIVEPVASLLGDYWPIVAILIGVVIWQSGFRIRLYRTEDHQTGKTA